MHHDSSLHPDDHLHDRAEPADLGRSGWSRRTVIGAGGAALLGLTWANAAEAADTVQTFSFDPTVGGTCVSPGCSVCNACLAHAANKLFATEAAAQAGRAHPGCRCAVVPGMAVAQTVFDQLFVAGSMADRRTPAIGALLASAPATVEAPGISGLVPTAVTVGGLVTIAWIALSRRAVDRTP
ncbi:MAG: hypothetical protein NTZ21_16100 [Actinobacteria bacterium]|nr:hypothetical protein [Actinomycetota bacterium]